MNQDRVVQAEAASPVSSAAFPPVSAAAAEAKPDRKPLIPGKAWPWVVVCMLAMNVGVCAITVTAALKNPAARAVEPNYYDRAVAWDDTKARFPTTQTLGWSVQADLALGAPTITLRLLDRAGEPVEGDVRVMAFHQGRSGERVEIDLESLGAGVYSGRIDVFHAGLWEVRGEIVTDRFDNRGGRFTTVVDVAPNAAVTPPPATRGSGAAETRG